MHTRRALIAVSILAPALALARWATSRTRLEDTLTTDVAIPYGEAGGRGLLLDVYSLPQRKRPRPAVLLIHGGGFVSGSRTDADIVPRRAMSPRPATSPLPSSIASST